MQPADGGDGGACFFFSCAYAVGAAKSTTVVEPTIIAMASAMCFTILIGPLCFPSLSPLPSPLTL